MSTTLNRMTKIILTMMLVLGACFISTKVDAASYKDITAVDYNDSSDTVKIGKYYFYYEDGSYYATKSDIEEGKEIISDTDGSFFTNGKYGFYVQDGTLCRMKISNRKVKKLKNLDEDSEIVYVYSTSIFYCNDVTDDGSATLRCYNTKKKTDRAISYTVDPFSFTGSGKFLVYADNETDALMVRNCKKGYTKIFDENNYCYARTNGKKVVYMSCVDDSNYIFSYKISTGKVTKIAEVDPDISDGAFGAKCKYFVYELNGKYYKMNLKTKKVTQTTKSVLQKAKK